jgi:Ricin-type beta-trefoil lectin domain
MIGGEHPDLSPHRREGDVLMRTRRARTALVSAAACSLLLSMATPALAAPASPPTPVISPSLRAALPSPHAAHSGAVVPGITGIAAQKAGPRVSAAQRLAQIKAMSRATARHSGRQSRVAIRDARAGQATPGLASWSGTLHEVWGTNPNQTIYGAQATQSLDPGITVPSSSQDVLFTPTLDPSAIDCIEMTTAYFGGVVQVDAFDWCKANPTWGKITDVSTSFLGSYATTVNGHYFYSVQDVQTNPTTNSWTAYLYNYQTKAWDTYYTSASTSKLSGVGGGWDMDEVYTNYNAATAEGAYCTQTSGSLWESTGLQYQLTTGGAWTAATNANSRVGLTYPTGSFLGCANLGYALPSQNSTFAVTNATHGATEIIGTGSKRCIDTNQVKFADGTKEQLWDCHNGAGQTWTYNTDGELTVDGGKYCLDATGYGTANGTKLQIWSCNNTTNQEWTFSIHNTLVGVGSGKCVDASGYGTADGTQLQLWTCNATTNQQWTWG